MRKYCYIVILLHCFIVLALCGDVVLAQTPESPQSPQPTSSQVDDEKIREIRDQVQEKIQEKIQAIKEKGKLRGYVGEILSLDGLEITLETQRGKREVTVDEEATIIDSMRKKIDLEDLEVSDVIICMGNVDSEDLSTESVNQMIAKRIVVVPQPSKPPLPRRAIYGQVTETEIDESSLILTLIHPQKEKSTLRVEVTSKTKITKKVEGEIEKVKSSDIETDDRFIAIGTWDEDEEILTAKLIRVIPSKSSSEL